jgi:ribonuclease BN (tRNA processing enzyme)
MILKILGCGTIIAQKPCDRCSGYLIDNRLLIDCGPGIWHALCNLDTSIQNIEMVLISHFHVDHTSDLDAIMMTQYLSPQYSNEPLTIAGPSGLIDWFENLKRLAGHWIHDFNLKLIEIDREVRLIDYHIQAQKTGHTDNSLCYRITDKLNKSLFFSGDSDFEQNLIILAHQADLAIIEASNTEAGKVKGHLTPQLAGQIAVKAKVKKLVLTHMYPEVKAVNPLLLASKWYHGEIVIAQEGMLLNI